MPSTDKSPDPQTGLSAEKPLLDAWVKAGGSPLSYRNTPPLELNEYEEGKLAGAGVDFTGSRNFFEKAKGLMGEREFSLFAGDEADRSQTRESRGSEYGGLKPTNPTGLVIKLLIHRIEHSEIMSQPQPLPKQPGPVTPIQAELLPPVFTTTKNTKIKKRIELHDSIHNATGELASTNVVYSSRDFVVASLPHTNPGEKEVWSRTNGRKTLTIQAGWNAAEQRRFGLPYGILPRLMYFYIENEVVRRREPKILLGDSMYDFMRMLGIADSGQNYRALRNQAARLFSAKFQITEKLGAVGGATGLATENFPALARSSVFWESPRRTNPGQAELFDSYIVVAEEHFRQMLEYAYPIDANAVKFLKRSSLELDIYAWLCYRNHYLKKEIEIPFSSLLEQFGGGEYSRDRDFRNKFKKAFASVNLVWRGGIIHQFTQNSSLRLSPSRPQITGKRTIIA
jgi:hypothetical protein